MARKPDERPRRGRTFNSRRATARSYGQGAAERWRSHSKRGAEVAAIFYTLFESAKLAGVDFHRYVLEATRRAIASPGTATLPEDLT